MYKNEFEIDISRCVHALFKKKKFIALITALFLVIGFALTIEPQSDKYTAKATVYGAADGSYYDSANAVTAMNAYLDVATSYKVSQRAALLMGRSDVDANYIQEAITVDSSTNSSSTNFMTSKGTIITFSATTTDPELSMEMADATAKSYALEMNAILNEDSIKVLDTAYEAELSYNAVFEAWKGRIKYALLGFVLACFIVVVCEVFDKKVRTLREATMRSELPVIGIIPDYKE